MENDKPAKQKLVDFTGYEGKWIILSRDETEIIAASDDLDEIADKLPQGILFKVPHPDFEYGTFFTTD